MIIKPSISSSGRREFLLNLLPGGTLFCFTCNNLLGRPNGQEEQNTAEKKHKFLEDSGMSLQAVFRFAFRGRVRMLQFIAKEIGKDNLIEMLKQYTEEMFKSVGQKKPGTTSSNDFNAYRARIRKMPDSSTTSAIVEDTDSAIEIRVTECLYAITYRKADGADFGYYLTCYPDFFTAKAFNPKLRLIRTKTLMEGHDYCNHRWVWEG